MLEPTSDNSVIYNEAMKAIQTGRFDDAFNLTKDLFALDPNDPTTLKVYGTSCFLCRKEDEANNCLKHIQNLDMNIGLPIMEFWAQNLASYLIYDVPAYLYSLILENQPENGEARATYSRLLLNSGQFEKAIEEMATLKKNHADLASVWELDTEINLAKNNKKEAQKAALKAIEINPFSFKAFQYLVELTKADPKVISDLNIEAFVAGAESDKTNPMIRAQLNFTLAALFEYQEDYEYAFKHYQIANNILNGLYGLMNIIYNPQEIEEYSKSIKDIFGTPLEVADATKTTQHPIFILGLPESGTSLVEDILNTHSRVKARGEGSVLSNFANNICSTALLDGVEDARQTASDKIGTLRDSYLEGDNASVIADKTMTNFFHIGLIKTLFPDAKFIYVKSSLMATCFNNFIKPLSHYYAYSTSLPHTKHFFRTCEDMMGFWKKNFGQDIYELEINNLMDNPEKEIRALLEHCELDFEDKCLTPNNSENIDVSLGAIGTLNLSDKEAINRWEPFKPHLTSLT